MNSETLLFTDYSPCGHPARRFDVSRHRHGAGKRAVGPNATPKPTEIELSGGLSGEAAGTGPPVVLLHGLSATRRNVVQGSRHLVKRGYRLIAYDARGHGASAPAPDPEAYEYTDLVGDLERVLEELEIERPVLVGSSMGAATAMAFALAHPDRVPALVQITPAYTGERTTRVPPEVWARLADALEDGVDSFVEAAVPDDMPDRWREVARESTRQRMERHQHPEAVAAALRVVPFSSAFQGLEQLETLDIPTLVVGDRDEPDQLHPLDIARKYADLLP